MDTEDRMLHASTLRALTRLMSQWSSLEYQRRITADSGVCLDPVAVRAVYTLGIAGAPVRPSSIADELHLTRPSTSKLIARLISAGLIEKTPDAEDGRAALVGLTAHGSEVFEQLFAAGLDMLEAATSTWDRAEVQDLSVLLTRFTDGLLAAPSPTD